MCPLRPCWVAAEACATSQDGRGRLYSHMEPQRNLNKDFTGGAVVKNPPANAGDTGLIPNAVEQLSPCATTTEVCMPRACALQQEKPPR